VLDPVSFAPAGRLHSHWCPRPLAFASDFLCIKAPAWVPRSWALPWGIRCCGCLRNGFSRAIGIPARRVRCFCRSCYGLAAFSIAPFRLRETTTARNGAEPASGVKLPQELERLARAARLRSAMLQLVLLYSILAALYVLLRISLASAIRASGHLSVRNPAGDGAVGMAVGALAWPSFGQGLRRRLNGHLRLGMISFSPALCPWPGPTGTWCHALALCAIGLGNWLLRCLAIRPDQPSRKTRQSPWRGKVFGCRTI